MGRVVFTGGTVVTFDGSRADAVVVDGDRISAVGTDLDTTGCATTVDLRGRCLVPAFRDGHAHPLHAGINRLQLDLSGIGSLDELLDVVRAWHLDHPGGDWVVGRGYEPALLPHSVGRAEWIDAVCADRPVALFPSDNHAVWINGAALRAAGIARATPDPERGCIVRDGDGSPSGMLLEFGGIDLIAHHLPPTTPESSQAGLIEAMRALAAEGIVWAQDASVRLDELDVYLAGSSVGAVTCRIDAAFRADPATWPSQRHGFLAGRALADGDPWISATTVKFFADGVIEAGTGYLLEPYADGSGLAGHSCGLPNWSAEGLAEAVRAFDADGFQIHVHAIGDAGVRMSLDAIEHAGRLNGRRDRRPVIAHTQLVHPADRPRFAALGVIANFEPLWACLDDAMEQLTVPRLGPARSALQYPIASILRSGAPVSFGSDWPVSSHRPLDGLAVAVTRRNRRGEPVGGWVPEERIPMLQALRAYTAGTAHQAFDDDAGSIAVGQRADLVVLDRDVTALAGEEVPGASVDETWIGGRRVFSRSG